MNFWTFLDRNIGILIFFVFVPLLFFGAGVAIEVSKHRAACAEVKP